MCFTFGCGSTVPPTSVVVLKHPNGTFDIYRNGNYHAWGRDLTIFIDGSINKYDEDEMHVLCRDQIPVIADIKYFGKFDLSDDKTVGKIMDTIKPTKLANGDYTIEFNTFYKAILESTIRSITRSVIAPYVTDNLQDLRDPVEKSINERVLSEISVKGFPVITIGLKVSDLDYEKAIKEKKNSIKTAELDDLEKAAIAAANVRQAKRNAELAIENGKAQIETALATAKANEIVNRSLTPGILAMEQYKMYQAVATGPNNMLLLAPYDALTSKNFGPITSAMQLSKRPPDPVK
jgi:hypothetical protein